MAGPSNSPKSKPSESASVHIAAVSSADPVVKALSQPSDLPSLPTILIEIQRIINDPKSSGADLRDVIEKDPAMTASVLKLINSAFYSIPGGVSNLQRAIAYLGYDAIYQVALTVSIMKTFKIVKFPHFSLGDFWKHSLNVATWSEEIARAIRHSKPSDCFTAGLLHDLGKIFIAKEHPEGFKAIVTKTFSENKSFFDVELSCISLHHTDVAERLGTHWRLPRSIVACMKWHHKDDPMNRLGATPEDNQMIDIVMMANSLSHINGIGNSGYPPSKGEPTGPQTRLLMKGSQLEPVRHRVEKRMAAAEAFLSLL